MEFYSKIIPPENLAYCKSSEGTYDDLLPEMYNTINWDIVVTMGDFNARTGNLQDYCDVDELSPHQTIDTVVNNDTLTARAYLTSQFCLLYKFHIQTTDGIHPQHHHSHKLCTFCHQQPGQHTDPFPIQSGVSLSLVYVLMTAAFLANYW